MKQLTQNLKSGKMDITEVPYPVMNRGQIIVRNHFSLISAGTEGGKVKTARSSLLSKAKQKPEQVKQVIDSVKSEGLKSTYEKVMNKLDSLSPLGYSAVGEIIDIGVGVDGFHIGDYVACGGAESPHSEVISVPKNLCVKVPKGVDLKYAAYTTVASIALQGIRQADLRLGENCVVIGLGLIGQLTVQMLHAGGIKVAGVDIDDDMVNLSIKSSADLSINRSDEKLENMINEFSNGYGVDAVIITAGTTSLDPVELAGKLCRKKGKVIIVGAVPTGFSRSNYYKKELELRMSSSYGPGRYDDNYEQKGMEYPIGYVRWTENRNMQAFLDLLKTDKLNIEILTTHLFDFNQALAAYELITNKNEPYCGILLKYDTERIVDKNVTLFYESRKKIINSTVKIGFIGAGNFAQKFLLPNAVQYGEMVGVITALGNESRNIADKYKFKMVYSEVDALLKDENINTVFIATRHDTHADYVFKSIKAGKNIFVEKPLCLTEDELIQIKKEYEQNNIHLMVGFNRRFSPIISNIRQILGKDTPKAINYRINVGHIPPDHWTQDKDIGGGRIIGEVCHFVDLCMYLVNSKPISINAMSLDSALNLNDTLIINIKYENGSIASISYFANGSKQLEKEYLEIYAQGMTAIIHDFKSYEIYGRKKYVKSSKQDKGHAEEIKQFITSVKEGKPTPICFEEICMSSLLPFKIIESINKNQMIQIP